MRLGSSPLPARACARSAAHIDLAIDNKERDMITISLAEAKNRFSERVTRVQNGEQVSVTRRGKPVVNIVAAGSATEPQPQTQVAEVFEQLAAIGAHCSLSGDLKVIAREGLD